MVLMNLYPFASDGDVGLPGIDPAARIVVMDAVLLLLQGFVRMSAKDAVCSPRPGVQQRTRSHFQRHAQPARVQAVNKARHRLALEVELLHLEIDHSPEMVEPEVVHHETVELMPV